ncbi:adaptin-binding domain-containing protein [Aspergillus saccharolyticus JOP 1030-1]|uniref:Alpha and gamma adaptin binding protein p34 n=1 Tax=Aspergillus saccharolyticus JOP 1030-1 TaxID=1450539 RepID=A0A318Z1V8_9EURO|nr:hypothetical protein BP01DRAFT_395941 [Aspergillus saccharolyticus JOP 1030-1]PYH40374.1 hypothetical protein BP01DRAFT_395941 [Aspergillus saccharolyticus JOP 1030-1]
MSPDNPNTTTATRIRNPRRLLILSPSSQSTTIIPPLLHTLTGAPVTEPPSTTTTPTPTTALSSTATLVGSSASSTATAVATTSSPTITATSFAGYTTHSPLSINNRYYTAEIPVWVDEIPLTAVPSSSSPSLSTPTAHLAPSPAQWKAEFSGADARVVRDAIGAVIICVSNPVDRQPSSLLPTGLTDLPSSSLSSIAAGTTSTTTREPAEDRPDVRSLKEFIHAIGAVRGLIEEERGGVGVGEVPGLLVLVEQRENMPPSVSSSPSPSSFSSSATAVAGKIKTRGSAGLDGLDDLDDDLNVEIDEPFSVGWWEDQLCEMGLMGWEVVRWCPNGAEDEGRNRYGELQGMRRVKEVLETHDWSASEDAGGMGTEFDDDDDLERQLLGVGEEGEAGFDVEVNELEREMVGLRTAIERGSDDYFVEEDEADEELRVDAVEALLRRMRAIKDMSDGLPETERKRFAAKAVRDIMKQL